MKRNMTWTGAALLAVLCVASPALAEVLTLTATQAVVLPASEFAPTRLALQFDLSGMASGEGRRIDSALLDWSLAGVSSEATSEFALYGVTASWSAAAVGTGTAVSTDETASAEWDITPLDYERNGGGFVRFDLTALVREWAAGERQNYGVLIAAPHVSEQAAEAGLAAPRLVVRYGFLK